MQRPARAWAQMWGQLWAQTLAWAQASALMGLASARPCLRSARASSPASRTHVSTVDCRKTRNSRAAVVGQGINASRLEVEPVARLRRPWLARLRANRVDRAAHRVVPRAEVAVRQHLGASVRLARRLQPVERILAHGIPRRSQVLWRRASRFVEIRALLNPPPACDGNRHKVRSGSSMGYAIRVRATHDDLWQQRVVSGKRPRTRTARVAPIGALRAHVGDTVAPSINQPVRLEVGAHIGLHRFTHHHDVVILVVGPVPNAHQVARIRAARGGWVRRTVSLQVAHRRVEVRLRRSAPRRWRFRSDLRAGRGGPDSRCGASGTGPRAGRRRAIDTGL